MQLWRLANPRHAGWPGSLETQEESMLQFQVKGHQAFNLSLKDMH